MTMRIPSVYTRIRYSNETEEQFEARCRYIEEYNREAERIEKAWREPMKVRAGWDCGCQDNRHTGCEHPWCPRAA